MANTKTDSLSGPIPVQGSIRPVDVARRAREAANLTQASSNAHRNRVLLALADTLTTLRSEIVVANAADVAKCSANIPLRSRLNLFPTGSNDNSKFDPLVSGVKDVARLPSPTGAITLLRELAPGLLLRRETCPIGVLLVIFEARPEVVIQITALAIKSGNALILKGGSEATKSNSMLFTAVRTAIQRIALEIENERLVDPDIPEFPVDCVQLVETRSEINALLSQDRYIDLVIPRGSAQLVRHIQNNTRIPVMGHADGICSVFIRADCDTKMATRIVVDAKTNYPAACNSAENLILDRQLFTTSSISEQNTENDERDIAKRPRKELNQVSKFTLIMDALIDNDVELFMDNESFDAFCIKPSERMSIALEKGKVHRIKDTSKNDDDDNDNDEEEETRSPFETEYLDRKMSVKTVGGTEEAIKFINSHSSSHTDCIVTSSQRDADKFLARIDSAGVYWNCSTRFADGFRYGFGAEIGVSTAKTHARGPVGLEGIVIYKYKLIGAGHCAGDFGPGKQQYTHVDLPLPSQIATSKSPSMK